MSPYAEGTSVPQERSQAEIQGLLRRYGADGFMLGWEGPRAAIAFRAHERQVRFELLLPTDPAEFAKTAKGQRRAPAAAKTAMEQEQRRLWRALALVIKAKLEAVESGIVTFEEEFMAHIVLPGGRTVGQEILPGVSRVYATGEPLALLPGSEA